MNETLRRPHLRLIAAVLLALTTVLVGFAHRSPSLDVPGYGAVVSAHLLPDGSLPALCDHGEDAAPTGGRAVAVCDACILTSAPGLGAVADVVPEPIVDRPIGQVAAVSARGAGARLQDARARGPPMPV